MLKESEFDCVVDMICYNAEDAESDVRAFRGRTGQLVFCSTVDVFTKTVRSYPITEKSERNPSVSFPYAYNKAICEKVFEEAQDEKAFPVTILRPAATYNNTSTPISLLGQGTALLKRIRQGMPVIVLGDGLSIWVSSHRDDVGNAFIGAIGNPKTYGKGYNITGDEIMTWEEYFLTVARVMGVSDIDFVRIPTDLLVKLAPKATEWCRINFKYNNIFDNSLAKSDLSYKYAISWEEGVKRMVTYHDSYGGIDGSAANVFYDLVVAKYRKMAELLARELAAIEE